MSARSLPETGEAPVEGALCAELPADPPRGSALLNPDLFESHPHQPIRNSCLAATTKPGHGERDKPLQAFVFVGVINLNTAKTAYVVS
jgi:hypothetical protein